MDQTIQTLERVDVKVVGEIISGQMAVCAHRTETDEKLIFLSSNITRYVYNVYTY